MILQQELHRGDALQLALMASKHKPGRPRKDAGELTRPPVVGWVIREAKPDPNDGRRWSQGHAILLRDPSTTLLEQGREVDAFAAERGLRAVEIRSSKTPQEAMGEWDRWSREDWVKGWRKGNAAARRTQRSREKASGRPSRKRLRCEDCDGVGHWELRTPRVFNTPLGRIEAWRWKTILQELDRRIRRERGEAVEESVPDLEPPFKRARKRTPGRWFVCRACDGTGLRKRAALYSFDSAFGPLLETTAGAAAEAAALGLTLGLNYRTLPLGANYKAMALELRARYLASQLRYVVSEQPGKRVRGR